MVYRIYYVGEGKDKRKYAQPVRNREELMALRNSPKNLQNLTKARQGDVKAKADLEQLAYNLGHVNGLIAGCKSIGSYFFHDVDCYGSIDNGQLTIDNSTSESERIKNLILEKKDEIGLKMLERSASGGWHLVCERRPGTTILENQVRVATILKLEMDTSPKDLQRVVFSTSGSEEDLPYFDDCLFAEPMSAEECEAEYERLKERQRRGEEDVPAGAKKANKHYRPWEEANTNFTNNKVLANTDNTDGTDNKFSNSQILDKEKNPSDPNNPCSESVTALPDGATSGARQSSSKLDSALAVTALQCYSSKTTNTNPASNEYNGVAFTDIIRKYWELFNGGKEPVEGDRNALTFELAVTLRSICGFSLERLMQVVPNYWAKSGTAESVSPEDYAEWKKTLENALKEPHKGMPYRLKQVLQALKSQQGVKACGGTLTAPPPMPKKLPPLIRLLTKNVPWYYKPAVANAVFPALGVHLHGVKFRYWDNVEHEATFMNVLIGRQSIGKGSVKKPIEYIMEDIRQRDLPNRMREAEWKQKNPGAKQKKDPRPADICIQMLIDNLTDAVFNQRIVDANNNGERFIYTSVDEIEALKKVTSRGTADEVGLLIRKAFDNSLAGQERVGADSVSGIAPLRWNFNASTTPPNARRFFGKMVNDGTVSRLDVATIIRADDDEEDEAPVLGLYDEQFAQELKPYIERLEAASGLIECPQAKRLALDIRTENRDAARLYESEAYRVLSYRANVIAWLKGMLLYVAHDYHWSKEIADFVRWTEQYNLWCKMLYFGQQLEKELREEIEIQRQSGPQNLLDLLPDEFNKEQYRLMRQQQGKTGDGDSTLRSWQSRGYIAYDEVSGRYCKVPRG